jgi:hypothetical protein
MALDVITVSNVNSESSMTILNRQMLLTIEVLTG